MSNVSDRAISDTEVRRAAAPFASPDARQSIFQLATSFGPFLAACVAMHLIAPQPGEPPYRRWRGRSRWTWRTLLGERAIL